jgi:hypothetical protein
VLHPRRDYEESCYEARDHTVRSSRRLCKQHPDSPSGEARAYEYIHHGGEVQLIRTAWKIVEMSAVQIGRRSQWEGGGLTFHPLSTGMQLPQTDLETPEVNAAWKKSTPTVVADSPSSKIAEMSWEPSQLARGFSLSFYFHAHTMQLHPNSS